jgi:hypothetical protein
MQNSRTTGGNIGRRGERKEGREERKRNLNKT